MITTTITITMMSLVLFSVIVEGSQVNFHFEGVAG